MSDPTLMGRNDEIPFSEMMAATGGLWRARSWRRATEIASPAGIMRTRHAIANSFEGAIVVIK